MTETHSKRPARKRCCLHRPVITILMLVSCSAAMASAPDDRWKDSSLTSDARAQALLATMTLDEKIDLLRTLAMPSPSVIARRGSLPASAGFVWGVPRLDIPPIAETDASMGVANIGHLRPGDEATALPAALALGASWDMELARQGGVMIGSEARSKGFGIMLAGGVNLIRDPRAGRNFEYLSEDPLLSGRLAGSAVAGIQSNGIISTIKHFALNDQETGRSVYSVDMPEAQMRESDLLAFQIANEIGQPGSVMCAYSRVNGEHTCQNAFLLTDVLRGDWKFDGFVMSDWGSVHSTSALTAGLDMQSGADLDAKEYLGTELRKEITAGKVPPALVDRAARRILRTLFAHGLIDRPPTTGVPIDYQKNSEIALSQAAAGMVLLQNEGNLLPLSSRVRRIALIGGHGDIGVLSGGGSSQVIPVGGAKLEIKLGEASFASMVRRTYGGTPPLEALRAAFPQARVDYVNGKDSKAAASLAAQADIAIVLAEKWSFEGFDSADLTLGEGQDELITHVAQANPRTVVVIEAGNPVLMPWRDKVKAIIMAWYPGQRGGDAIARVLSGAVNPSGHLPITWPAATDQLPLPVLPGTGTRLALDSVTGTGLDAKPFSIVYPEGSDAGYRWFDKKGVKPPYSFGYGLSYTAFRYRSLDVTEGVTPSISFSISNVGHRTGTDVAQVYAKRPNGGRRLIGWARVTLKSGESRRVTVKPDLRVLADYDTMTRRWIVGGEQVKIEVSHAVDDPELSRELTIARQFLAP